MLFLKIKQAETALTNGRLDEAFELLQDRQLRDHQRGQKLIGKLTQALVNRSREHLQANRLPQALTDCNRADKLSGNLGEVAELRTVIAQAVRDQQNSQHRRGRTLNQAREHIKNGRLSAGESLLQQNAQNNPQAALLLQEAAARRGAVDTALARMENALQCQDWKTAVTELLKARKFHHTNQRIIDLNQRITTTLTEQIKTSLNEGRLDRASSLIITAQPLAEQALELRELQQALRRLRQAYQHLENAQPYPAGEILRRVASVLPGIKWLTEAIKHTEQMTQAAQALRTGPLGLLEAGESRTNKPGEKIAEPTTREQDRYYPVIAAEATSPEGTDLVPSRFLIQIDGVGSFPVFREAQVTLGPISSSQRPDLALIAEPELPVATIERTEEDYFISTEGQILVNDQPVNQKLLADGDKLALSPRCRLTFRRPNAASTSALLVLAGARMPRVDVRQVLLLDREIIIGPAPTAHIRVERLTESAVLYLNDGRLLCRSKSTIKVGDKVIDRSIPLVMDKTIKIGELSFVLTNL